MARPRKDEHEQRRDRTTVRFTAAEKAFVEEQAGHAGMVPADFIRHRALGLPVQPSPRRADAALLSELNRIGVNVNQLARAVHTERDFARFWSEVGGELRAVLEKVSRAYGSEAPR